MRCRFAFTVAIFLMGMPGCLYLGYSPNRYYGPGPVVAPGQPWNGYPATPTYPYYQPGPGTPIMAPGGNSPTPLNGGNQPGFTTDPNNPQTYGSGGTSAPTFNSTPGTNNSGGGVPDPNDDGNSGNSNFNRGTNRSPLTPTTSATAPNDVSTPFSQQESRLPRNFTDDVVAENYVQPVVQPTDGRGGDIQQVNNQSPAGRPAKTYAHHPKFNWVQGVVEFDEPSSTWVIMYDDNPGTSDPFGGELTIAGDLTRARLRSGDVVRIDGAVDQTEEDSRGKPVYQATKLQKL